MLFLLIFLRRILAHRRGTFWLLGNQPGRRVDWICLKHFLISSLCVLFLSNVIWLPQQRFNCISGLSQTWALLSVLLKFSQLLVLRMKNWKHIESNLVYYWFEHHFFLLTSTFSFFFLQLKIGILIAQPQFLIHDAQKGHGLLISSDYEAH